MNLRRWRCPQMRDSPGGNIPSPRDECANRRYHSVCVSEGRLLWAWEDNCLVCPGGVFWVSLSSPDLEASPEALDLMRRSSYSLEPDRHLQVGSSPQEERLSLI